MKDIDPVDSRPPGKKARRRAARIAAARAQLFAAISQPRPSQPQSTPRMIEETVALKENLSAAERSVLGQLQAPASARTTPTVPLITEPRGLTTRQARARFSALQVAGLALALAGATMIPNDAPDES